MRACGADQSFPRRSIAPHSEMSFYQGRRARTIHPGMIFRMLRQRAKRRGSLKEVVMRLLEPVEVRSRVRPIVAVRDGRVYAWHV
jgi:hypothetical protein